MVCVFLHYPSIFWSKNLRSTCHLPFLFSSEFLHLPSCQHGILLQKERSTSVIPYCDVAKSCDHNRRSMRAFAQKFQKWTILGPISLQRLMKKLSKVIVLTQQFFTKSCQNDIFLKCRESDFKFVKKTSMTNVVIRLGYMTSYSWSSESAVDRQDLKPYCQSEKKATFL